eukprot:1136666-Pelagomonas_calceolata.AAC.4
MPMRPQPLKLLLLCMQLFFCVACAVCAVMASKADAAIAACAASAVAAKAAGTLQCWQLRAGQPATLWRHQPAASTVVIHPVSVGAHCPVLCMSVRVGGRLGAVIKRLCGCTQSSCECGCTLSCTVYVGVWVGGRLGRCNHKEVVWLYTVIQ